MLSRRSGRVRDVWKLIIDFYDLAKAASLIAAFLFYQDLMDVTCTLLDHSDDVNSG